MPGRPDVTIAVSIALASFCYGAHIDGLGRDKRNRRQGDDKRTAVLQTGHCLRATEVKG